MKIYEVNADRMTFLFWSKEEAEFFMNSQGAAFGGSIIVAQVLGENPCLKCENKVYRQLYFDKDAELLEVLNKIDEVIATLELNHTCDCHPYCNCHHELDNIRKINRVIKMLKEL